MLYKEFIEGTGCKDNQHNFKVYKDLEVMYMNSLLSKQDIYEYGKKLVDNSPSPEQIEFEEGIKKEIAYHKSMIKSLKESLTTSKKYGWDTGYETREIRYHKQQINGLKFVLGI